MAFGVRGYCPSDGVCVANCLDRGNCSCAHRYELAGAVCHYNPSENLLDLGMGGSLSCCVNVRGHFVVYGANRIMDRRPTLSHRGPNHTGGRNLDTPFRAQESSYHAEDHSRRPAMILHPTVVIGLGSTGKHVVANAQKYLYEVLNGEQLNLFQFIVLETAVNQQDQGWTAPGVNTRPTDINVQDIGAAYNTLKLILANEFSWCPQDMHIHGSGAGNKRAGGRLMLFRNMEMIERKFRTSIDDVTTAANDPQTTIHINRLLASRGGNQQEHPLPTTPVPVVLVVGTLTGGTCSGACVDLGYLLRRVAPSSNREAIFFMPDNTAIATYKANSWAALSDLVYFTEHPSDYEAVWLDEAQGRRSYQERDRPGPLPPYNRVYLVTERDRNGNPHMPYRDDPGSPLLMMAGLTVATNLLGLYELRQTNLVNLNQRVGKNPIYNTFLTQSVRGVSYPKYEISEGAACEIIAGHICKYWIDTQACWVQGRREELQREEISKQGRDLWNRKCQPIWEGLRANLKQAVYAHRIRDGKVPDVADYLKAEITENRDGTIFRTIDQNVENRGRELQNAIQIAWVEILQQKQNLQYADWFLDGVQGELRRARRFWEGIKIPTGENDVPAWQAQAGKMGERLVARHTGLSVNLLFQRMNVIEDELDQIITRLEMFLMYSIFGKVTQWVDSGPRAWVKSARLLLTDVQTYASARGNAIRGSLQDVTGPLLKVSRSRFSDEIVTLAKSPPSIPGRDYVDYLDGKIIGMLSCVGEGGSNSTDNLFQELIDRTQPQLIQELQKGGPIDIVTEVEKQHVSPQVALRARETQTLSLTTRQDLMIGGNNVPSYILTKSAGSSARLEKLLRISDANFPSLHQHELPLFDHMALFYQEGAKFNLDSLQFGDDLRRSFNEAKKEDEAVLDPLRLLKLHSPPPDAAAASAPASRSEQSELGREA